MYILYFALLGSALIFINLNHPVALGLTLILHTLLISGVTGLAVGNFWFSYVLFLVFLGGVLVLFIYITSLASNEKFSLNWAGLFITALVGCVVLVGVLFYMFPAPDTSLLIGPWCIETFRTMGVWELVSKLYSTESFKVTILLILYLLYALLVCANIVRKYSGALRNFN